LLIILVLELGIRGYDVWQGRGFFYEGRNILKQIKPLVPFRTFGFPLYREVNGKLYISFRQEELYPFKKPKGTFRIICFGGSTTEQITRDGWHYPLLLQYLLRKRLKRDNIEVINVGNSAYATPHSLILLELDVLWWNPDLVVLSHNVNDLGVMYWPGFRVDYSNKYETRFYSVPDYASRFTLPNVLFQHFQIYWVIRERLKMKLAEGRGVGIRRKSYGDRPNLLAQKVFEQNLRSFVTLAKSKGIKVILGTQPLQPSEEYFLRHIKYKEYNSIVVYPLHNEFVKHHRAYNDIIRKVARETGVGLVDNAALLGGDKKYFIDFVHYTERGLGEIARNFAEYIISHNLVK